MYLYYWRRLPCIRLKRFNLERDSENTEYVGVKHISISNFQSKNIKNKLSVSSGGNCFLQMMTSQFPGKYTLCSCYFLIINISLLVFFTWRCLFFKTFLFLRFNADIYFHLKDVLYDFHCDFHGRYFHFPSLFLKGLIARLVFYPPKYFFKVLSSFYDLSSFFLFNFLFSLGFFSGLKNNLFPCDKSSQGFAY
jgi:hypothetical protein